MATLATENRPRVADWFARIKACPRYKGSPKSDPKMGVIGLPAC
jgi:hypothetical protein